MIIKDHLGHEFHSQKEMATWWGVNYRTFQYRRNTLGWSVKKALTADLFTSGKPIYDHLGNEYRTLGVMANHYGLTVTALKNRISYYGWPLEKALTTPAIKRGHNGTPVKDHLGHCYPTLSALADAYGIKQTTLTERLKRGWPLKKALTTPIKK